MVTSANMPSCDGHSMQLVLHLQICWKSDLHSIIQPCGLVPRLWNMSIIFCGTLEQSGNIHVPFIESCWLGNSGGVTIPTLCARITIQPKNIHRKHCSSQYYSSKILLIAAISLKTPTLFTIFSLFKPTLFIVLHNESISSYPLSFFSWR